MISEDQHQDQGSREESCPICMNTTRFLVGINKCPHKFCLDCITNWKSSGKGTCPACRVKFTKILRLVCSICSKPSDFPAALDCCNHIFCCGCIEKWSKTSSNCPVCEKPFSEVMSDVNEGECRICKSKMIRGSHLACCGHSFCFSCIEDIRARWMKKYAKGKFQKKDNEGQTSDDEVGDDDDEVGDDDDSDDDDNVDNVDNVYDNVDNVYDNVYIDDDVFHAYGYNDAYVDNEYDDDDNYDESDDDDDDNDDDDEYGWMDRIRRPRVKKDRILQCPLCHERMLSILTHLKGDKCVCCLGTIKPDNRGATDGCDHYSCYSCLEEWQEFSNCCPKCDAEFTKIVYVVLDVGEKVVLMMEPGKQVETKDWRWTHTVVDKLTGRFIAWRIY